MELIPKETNNVLFERVRASKIDDRNMALY